jgi:CheY-like chemotaxis protein
VAADLVLVIDDDDDLRNLCRVNLEVRGLRVAEAANGADGLAAAKELRPALILLDLTMPDIDGWGVLHSMRSDPALAGVPVVVLTGIADEATELRARDAGAESYVAKPVLIDDLMNLIIKHLDPSQTAP